MVNVPPWVIVLCEGVGMFCAGLLVGGLVMGNRMAWRHLWETFWPSEN